MTLQLKDFLPVYPNIADNEFYQKIYNKHEFRELKLKKDADYDFSDYLPSQKIIMRFLSSYTPYNNLLLYHEMGTGKTCAAVGVAENLKSKGYRKCVYISKGEPQHFNFKNEVAYKCTKNGEYLKKVENSNLYDFNKKEFEKFYECSTYQKFSDESPGNYENCIIILDEVHNLIVKDYNKLPDSNYNKFHNFLHKVKNCKILLLTGTPITDKENTFTPIMNLILPLGSGQIDDLEFENLDTIKEKIKGYVSFLSSPKTSIKLNFVESPIKIEPVQSSIVLYYETMSKYQTKKYLEVDSTKDDAARLFERQASLFVKPEGPEINIDYEVYQTISGFNKSGPVASKRDSKVGINTGGWGSRSGTNGFKGYLNGYGELDNTLKSINWKKDTANIVEIFLDKFLKSFSGNFEVSNYKVPNKNSLIKTCEKLEKEQQKTYLSQQWKLYKLLQSSVTYFNTIKNVLKAIEEGKKVFIYNSFVNGHGVYLFALIMKEFGISNDKILVLTNDTLSNESVKSQLIDFNIPDSNSKIQIILGSNIISEGYTFKNIEIIHIQTPSWNYSETSQIIARGYRAGSHDDLIKSRNGVAPIVDVYLHASIPLVNNMNVINNSIDIKMYEISAEKWSKAKLVETIAKKAAIDCSLAQDRNLNNSSDKYLCDGNIDLNSPEDYSTFILYYSKEIKNEIYENIIDLFKFKNVFTLDEIYESIEEGVVHPIIHDKKSTLFLILEILNNIIVNNEIIYNNIGIGSFLRYENNTYFCVNSIFTDNNILMNFYSKWISVYKYNTVNNWLDNKETEELVKTIKLLYSKYTQNKNITNDPSLENIFDSLNSSTKEMLYKQAELNPDNNFSKFIMSNFKVEKTVVVKTDENPTNILTNAKELGIMFYGTTKAKKNNNLSIVWISEGNVEKKRACKSVDNNLSKSTGDKFCIQEIINQILNDNNNGYKMVEKWLVDKKYSNNYTIVKGQNVPSLNEILEMGEEEKSANNLQPKDYSNLKNDKYIQSRYDDTNIISDNYVLVYKNANIPFFPMTSSALLNFANKGGKLTKNDLCSLIEMYLRENKLLIEVK